MLKPCSLTGSTPFSPSNWKNLSSLESLVLGRCRTTKVHTNSQQREAICLEVQSVTPRAVELKLGLTRGSSRSQSSAAATCYLLPVSHFSLSLSNICIQNGDTPQATHSNNSCRSVTNTKPPFAIVYCGRSVDSFFKMIFHYSVISLEGWFLNDI